MILQKIFRKVYNSVERYISTLIALVSNPYTRTIKTTYISENIYISDSLEVDHDTNFDFDVFGYKVALTNGTVNWHLDHIHCYTWPMKWHKLLPIKLNGHSDVKVPWELGRGHIFTKIACKTAVNQNYKKLYSTLIDDFISKNPVGYGVQWQCPMDAALRLVNLILSRHIMETKGTFPSEINDKFLLMLGEHYNYLKLNEEVFESGFKNNHYLADLLGQIWFCKYISSDSKELSFLIDKLLDEIEVQFNEDGSNFEGSTSYHFLSTEIIILCLITSYEQLLVHRRFDDLKTKLAKIISFSEFCITRKGLITRVGDDDSGMVIQPSNFCDLNLEEKALILNQNRIKAFRMVLNAFQHRGFHNFASKVLKELMNTELMETEFKMVCCQNGYSDFGIYKFTYKNFELFFRHLNVLGSNGNGGHNHQDDMSFELFHLGSPIIVDPGTFCYTSNAKLRNIYRGNNYHNVVSMRNNSQFSYKGGLKGLFKLDEKSSAYSSKNINGESIIVESNRQGAVISREIKNGRLEIVDRVTEKGGVARFHLHPSVSVRIVSSTEIIAGNVKFKFIGASNFCIQTYMYSNFYLNETESSVIEVFFDSELITHICNSEKL